MPLRSSRGAGGSPDVPVALDGKAVMELLGLPPGPLIGAATRRLQDLHLARGPLSQEEAETLLRTWAAEQDSGRREGRTHVLS